MIVLDKVIEDGYEITTYSIDGVNVSHTERALIGDPMDDIPEPDPQPSAQDIQTQTLLNTEYLVAMTELSNI